MSTNLYSLREFLFVFAFLGGELIVYGPFFIWLSSYTCVSSFLYLILQ